MNLDSENYRATALRPARKMLFFKEVPFLAIKYQKIFQNWV